MKDSSHIKARRESDVRIIDRQAGTGSRAEGYPHEAHAQNANGAPFERRLRRRRRSFAVLIGTVVIVVLAIFGMRTLVDVPRATVVNQESPQVVLKPVFESVQLALEPFIPELSSFDGLMPEQVSAKLGSGYALVGNGEADEFARAELPDARSWVSYAYVAEEVLEPVLPTVTLWLDEGGRTVGVDYSASLDTLSYASTPFEDAVSNADLLTTLLNYAGVEDGVSSYSPPSPDSYTTYVDASADNRVVAKHSILYTGNTDFADGFSTWSIMVTYDYLGTGAEGELLPLRTVQIRMS